MTAAGFALIALFEHHVERRVVAGLEADLALLLSGFSLAADGGIVLSRRPADPGYAQPFSGSYWQVEAGDRIAERSRSLWDERLELPDDDPATGLHEHVVEGPQKRPLVAVERAVRIERPDGEVVVRFAVAQDRSETVAAVREFSGALAIMLAVLGGLLLLAFAVAVGVGLQPLTRMRSDLARLRSGSDRRLSGSYPSEVAVLVDDLNALLDQRERTAVRSRQRAADLAHGLKTPITAMAGIAEELAGEGRTEIADELARYSEAMHRHVERELALSRSIETGPAAKPTLLRPIVELLVASLKRLPRGGALQWGVDITDHEVAADPTALAEVLGNLLDNARKWATSRVEISARQNGANVLIIVSDDGPGVAAGELLALTERGRRLDLSQPGSGLGLSITRDIVEELGGSLDLANASPGGLQAVVTLPSRPSALPR